MRCIVALQGRLLRWLTLMLLASIFALARLDAAPPQSFPVRTFTPTAENIIIASPVMTTPTSSGTWPDLSSATALPPTSTHRPTDTPVRGCLGLPTPQLVIGAYGRVRPGGQANRLRSQPSISGQQIGSISPGRLFYVMGGPECSDNVTWWQVRSNELLGWTAESEENVYYTEPVSGGRMQLNLDGLDIDRNSTTDTFFGAYQPFQNGYMFWVAPVDDMWVLYTTGRGRGTWEVYSDVFREGDREVDTSIQAPSGFQQPRRGFGRIWRDNNTIRQGLGWATQSEQGYMMRYSYDPMNRTHTLVSPSGSRFILSDDGTWRS
jgi:hypothetical protein